MAFRRDMYGSHKAGSVDDNVIDGAGSISSVSQETNFPRARSINIISEFIDKVVDVYRAIEERPFDNVG